MIRWKYDVLSALKEKGFTSYRLRADKIMGQRDIQRLRDNELVSWANVNKLCELLGCNVGDLLDYVPDTVEEATDDAFCNALYEEYKASQDKGEAVRLEDAMKVLEVNKDA